ncbi:MAG: abortive infection family protein [Bacteroidia bacterium]
MEIDYLIIDLDTFSSTINKLEKEPEKLLSIGIASKEELADLMKQNDTWKKSCGDFLRSSFNNERNHFQKNFKITEAVEYDLSDFAPNVAHSANRIKNEIREKQRWLNIIGILVKILDPVLNPDHPDLERRKDFTIQEKEDFLLSKLFDLYENGLDQHISVAFILQYNGVILKRKREEYDIANSLEFNGYVDVPKYGSQCTAKITSLGIKVMESYRKEMRQKEKLASRNTLPVDPLDITNDLVKRAIDDAHALIQQGGATSGVDRVHTMLHGYLKEVGRKSQMQFSNEETLTQIFKRLKKEHPVFQKDGERQQDINDILNSLGNIMDKLGPLRNKASLSHPNEKLLDEDEAMLVVNTAHTVLNYLNRKFKTS